MQSLLPFYLAACTFPARQALPTLARGDAWFLAERVLWDPILEAAGLFGLIMAALRFYEHRPGPWAAWVPGAREHGTQTAGRAKAAENDRKQRSRVRVRVRVRERERESESVGQRMAEWPSLDHVVMLQTQT